MPAARTRQEARERLTRMFETMRDRLIPPDESKPLQGSKFRDWEAQADELDRAMSTSFLEERAALEENARVEQAGRCPHCGSEQVYLEKRQVQAERQTPHGLIVMEEQRCRCRSCDRTFSPSGAGLGSAHEHESLAQGFGAGGAGGGGAEVCVGGAGHQ